MFNEYAIFTSSEAKNAYFMSGEVSRNTRLINGIFVAKI